MTQTRGQRNSTLRCHSSVWKISFISAMLDLLCHWSADQNVTGNNLNSVKNRCCREQRERVRERVIDEKWALCGGARCPKSEPLLFTGSPLIPVRELSASELIWAALLPLLWPGRPDPSTAQCTHSVCLCCSLFLSLQSIHLSSLQFSGIFVTVLSYVTCSVPYKI